MPAEPKPLRIFLSYAHTDVAAVRKLYRYLREKGFDVWFDKENLVPGQDWQLEIEKGLSRSDVILICLSQAAVSAEGFVQREFRFALDRALEMPEGRIFLIPVRLQPCEAPTRLNRYHWVDLFEREGYSRLMRGLKHCAEQLERARVDESQPVSIPDPDANFGASISTAQDEAAKREKQTAEDERQAREEAEAQRIAQDQAGKARIAAEEAEKERLAKAQAESESIARLKADQERLARQKAEAERMAKQKAENKTKEKAAARAQTRANLKTPALLLGGLLLLGAGCLAAWLVWQAFPWKATPAATTEIRLPATLTPMPTVTPFTVMVSEKDGMKLHYVPAGPFKMGSDTYTNEKPIHTVTLSAFWIDETEVTNQMYARCVNDRKCRPHGNKSSSKRTNYYDDTQYADYPVIDVSWNDAIAYCSWAGRRLPGEAQWEKAARGPNGNTYPWGNGAPNKDLLNYNNNVGDTTKVGQYPNGKSFYGAQDMAGNVWEWINDWYSGTYYASSLSVDPPGPVSGEYRVLRGGSWNNVDDFVRSADRFNVSPVNRLNYVGFRCALSQ